MGNPRMDDRSGEMEDHLHQLEDHIADAEKQLEGRKADADILDDVAGDWEGEQDRGGGDDPQGAARDARQGAPGGSQDGPGAAGSDDPDERVDEELANPT